METINVAVVLASVKNSKAGKFACCTRPLEKARYDGDFGLPGGKVDPGESIRDAAIRESFEEGWDIEEIEQEPFFVKTVESEDVTFKCHWFLGWGAVKLEDFKESNRIKQVEKNINEIYMSGRHNDEAMRTYFMRFMK